jgi:hypothetical protein
MLPLGRHGFLDGYNTVKLVRVVAPHFVAGFETDGIVRRTASILKVMRGWTDERARKYITRKGWKASVVPEQMRMELEIPKTTHNIRGNEMKHAPTYTDLPKKLEGESHEDHWKRVQRWLAGEDVRSKVDLREWTGSPPFHLNREK